jgi:hypothetical protein
MHTRFGKLRRLALCLFVAVVMSSLASLGCGSGVAAFSLLGTPLFDATGSGAASTPSGGGGGDSSFFDTGGRVNVDPCAEPNSRKFIRISMRNLASDSYIHYFFVLIAYVNGDVYPDGAACPDDIALYTSRGYLEIPEEEQREFGNLCIEGPALFYFHKEGQFRSAGGVGGSQLGSAIAPAQGTNATFDSFFTAGGATVPVPNLIIFHNPGTTSGGQALKISINRSNPCGGEVVGFFDAACDQDAFYYVDESDLISGSIALGVGSGVRTPSEIQGTGCECLGFQDPFQQLAPSGTTASSARCNEFLRGGTIEYVFVREDLNPPFPQLVWRVTDQTGAEVHDFDPRANIP